MWRSRLPLLIVIGLEAALYSVLTPLLPRLVEDLELTKTTAGVLHSAYLVGSVVGSVGGASAIEKTGHRRMTCAALALMALSMIAFAWAEDFATATIARALMGFGGGVAWTAAMAWMVASSAANRRGTAVGTAMSLSILGTLLGPLLGNAAIVVGSRPLFIAVAVVCVGLALVIPADPVRIDRQPLQEIRVGVDRHRWAVLGGSIWVLVLMSFVYGAMFVLLPLRLAERGGAGACRRVGFPRKLNDVGPAYVGDRPSR